MKKQFVLRPIDQILDEIIERRTFIRYNMKTEYLAIQKYIKSFEAKKGRKPFIFEILNDSFSELSELMKTKIKDILFEKDEKWFFDVGQYFFYNLFQWIQNLNIVQDSLSKEGVINDFMEKWYRNFLIYEKTLSHEYSDSIKCQFPSKILLEITNNCNLSCIMCGVGQFGYDPSRNMSLDLLERLCEQSLHKCKLIRLNGLGESTIIPNFLNYLDLLKDLSAQLEIVTNLTVQKKQIWNKLIENNTNFLISCDSVNPKRYEAIRRGAKFSNFQRNLRYIGKNIADPLNAQIIFTLMEQNIDDLIEVIRFCHDYGLGGTIINVIKSKHSSSDWIDININKIKKNFEISYDLAKDLGINLKIPDHIGQYTISEKISTSSSNIFCYNPWNEVYIRYNGDLTACNMLNPYIYGNCQNNTLEEIWHGLNATMFRNFVNTKYRHHYCNECYYLT